MTEGEELKKAADMQRAMQRFEELNAYIDKLGEDMKRAFELHNRAGLICMAALATHMIAILASVFTPSTWTFTNEALSNLTLWIALGYLWIYAIPFFMGCRDEFRGCIKTLEILGIIDKTDGRKKKLDEYKESWIAKLWESMKQKARSSAYSPA